MPAWPYSRGWRYYPSRGVGLLIILIIMLLTRESKRSLLHRVMQ
ncbi:DUF3309 family protein [Legionella feeleii]|nr:DUF3309 family protein [Legionella feeleii]